MTKPGLLHGLVTVEEAAASAIKHVTDGIDDEEAMNRAPDLLAALAAAGWAVVPKEPNEAMTETEDYQAGNWSRRNIEAYFRSVLAARPR